MSDKFHNKYHGSNHHSYPLDGADDATDPIASSEFPFMGDFYLSGNMPISGGARVYGNIDLNNNEILNANADEGYIGVVRYATSEELTAEPFSSSVAVSPRDLDILIQKSVGHTLTDNSFHLDVSASGVSNADTLMFDGENWVNAPEIGINKIIYSVCGDAEASGVSGVNINDVYITPKQLHEEIRRQMPTFGVQFYNQNEYTINSLHFDSVARSVGWFSANGISISAWDGSDWITKV
jgi:hypothetical protein